MQSRRQLVYSVIIVTGVNILLQTAASFARPLGLGAVLGAHIGGALGGNLFFVAFLWESFPHRMFVTAAMELERLRLQISLLLHRYGYRVRGQMESKTVFVEALPAMLTWEEANVSLIVEAGGINVVGNGLVLKRLFRRLRRMQSTELQ
ncbi:MAG TPA: hypothetical protein VLV50_17150 [Stellaceae bacterium]|nr:hypothetical protein [Stellaceae bacterium]